PLVYLRQHHYTGNVYPVNPRHAEIGGFKAYPSLAALPERPDIVWIGVPGAQVEAALVEAARVGVPHAVILTAGFGETDAGGRWRAVQARGGAAHGGRKADRGAQDGSLKHGPAQRADSHRSARRLARGLAGRRTPARHRRGGDLRRPRRGRRLPVA